MKEELLPCAHCGGEAFSSEHGYVHCFDCSIRASTCIEWNTRISLAPISVEDVDVEALTEVIASSAVAEMAWKYCDLNDEENGDYNLELAQAIAQNITNIIKERG